MMRRIVALLRLILPITVAIILLLRRDSPVQEVANHPEEIRSKPPRSEPEPQTKSSTHLPGPTTLSAPRLVEKLKKGGYFTEQDASTLSAADLPWLTAEYRAATLTERRCLVWAFGLIGNEESVELLKHTLFDEFVRRVTSGQPEEIGDEEQTMFNTVRTLALLAEKYDGAYELLKAGTDPKYWQAAIRWSSERDTDTFGILASKCIDAMGMTTRPDARETLARLANTPLFNDTTDWVNRRSLAGAVVDAAFYQDLIDQQGYDGFRRIYFSTLDFELWRQWTKTENGQKWVNWHYDKIAEQGRPDPWRPKQKRAGSQ